MKKKQRRMATCHPDKPNFARGQCSACYNREYRKRPERKGKHYSSHLRRMYDIGIEDYERMEKHQGGLCAICHKPSPSGKILYVDHCHTNGHVRGLLCQKCNTAIGLFYDMPEICFSAAQYLTRNQSAYNPN